MQKGAEVFKQKKEEVESSAAEAKEAYEQARGASE